MAFIQVNKFTGDKTALFNLDFPVGIGMNNRKDDVMLVQALLDIVFYKTDFSRNQGHPPLPDIPGIEVDGICGTVTQRCIVHFKKGLIKLAAQNVFPDAVIRPFPPNQLESSAATHTFFTLVGLNRTAERASPGAQGRFRQLSFAADTPELLKQALSILRERSPGFRQGT